MLQPQERLLLLPSHFLLWLAFINSLALTKNCCPFFDPSLRFHEFSFEKHVIAVQTNLANGKTNFLESSQLEFS